MNPRGARFCDEAVSRSIRLRRRAKALLAKALLMLLFIPQVVQAHPADMYFHAHTVNFSRQGVQIVWELVPGPMITHVVWNEADANGDELVSTAEAELWIAPLLEAFSAKLDGTPLRLELASVQWAASMPELRAGDSPILSELTAEWEGIDLGAEHELLLLNDYNASNSLSWYSLNAVDGIGFSTPEQDNGVLTVRFGAKGATAWESGMPSIPPVVEALGLGETAEEAVAQAGNKQGILAILEGFLRTPEISPLLYLAAFVIALILGALHALSPGHGKTIVAAYLVGSQGRAYHAIVLGALVTLTHTGSVFILGLATLSLSQYIMPTQIFPALELVSGLLIVVLGLALLLPRLRTWLEERARKKAPAVAKKVDKGEKGTRLTIDAAIREPGPEHNHDPSQFGYVPIPKGVAEAAANPLSGISWRSLIALGISGGLVPCPDAIAILLIAITINRIGFGLSLIISFSLGLAIVLIAIGIVMVKSKQIFARLQWFSRASFVVPVISSLVVLGLGIGLSVSALKNFPADFSLSGNSDSFNLKKASVIYLAVDEKYHKQLYLVPATGGDVEQITNGDTGVWNYSVSPDGNSLIYSIPDGGRGSDLWYWGTELDTPELLLNCPDSSCSDVLWSPNRGQILYSRLDFTNEQAYLGIPSMWWLDLDTKETHPVFQDAQLPGYNPRWSYDGVWLSYTSASPQAIQIYNLEGGERQSLPTEIGSAAAWSPNANQFLLSDLQFIGDIYLNKISLYDVGSRNLTLLPTEENFDDSNPAWSRDGEWISFARGAWTLSGVSSGDQIWVSRADGSEARALTDDPETTHGPAAWSADGRYLLYRIYTASNTAAPSQVRILDMKTGEEIVVAAPGESPSWFLP
ncbi:MAG: hypothetical protein HN855_12495 [Anaerolineae bacterium]|nr:hypothetical protein [Anaerolineae bacterium]MBT7325973.1 hypothetical protein [Anaerolineae bacterium]